MQRNLVPFYTYNEKDRLNYSLFIDMDSMNIYRNYANSNSDFFRSGKYWALYYLSYWLLSQFKGFHLYMSTYFAIIVFVIAGGFGFWFGYYYLYKKGMEKTDLKAAYLTKEEFISYAKAGKKTYHLLLTTQVVFSVILCFSTIYFFLKPSFLFLIFLPLLTFIIGGIMRSIPYRRLQLHYNASYREKIATAVHEQLIS